MALEFDHGSLSWSSADAATHEYAVTGLAFKPKALMFFSNGIDSAISTSTTTTNQNMSIGFASGASDRRCIIGYSTDNSSSEDAAIGERTDCVQCMSNGTGGDTGRLDLKSIESAGFTLIVDVQATQSNRVQWMAWGGSDITNVATGVFQEPGATGTQDITSPGFQPSVVIVVSAKITSEDSISDTIDLGYSIGATDGTNQWSVMGNDDNASGSVDSDGSQNASEIVQHCIEGGGTSNTGRAGFVQWLSTGFQVNWLERLTTGRVSIFLAIKGGQWAAGSYKFASTNVNDTVTVSGLAFQPVGCLHCSNEQANLQAQDNVGTQNVVQLGWFKDVSSRAGSIVLDFNGSANADIRMALAYEAVLEFGTGTAYDVDVVNSDGFRMIVDSASGNFPQTVLYLAFGSAAGAAFLAHAPFLSKQAVNRASTF